jgi:hypothetical protein
VGVVVPGFDVAGGVLVGGRDGGVDRHDCFGGGLTVREGLWVRGLVGLMCLSRWR